MIRWILLLLFAGGAPLHADEAARTQVGFAAWLADRGGHGALVLWKDGKEVSLKGYGYDPSLSHPIASLSKAITASCALTLVEEGHWNLQTTAQDVLGLGPDITLAQLITHSGGIGPDATQGIRNIILARNLSRAPRVSTRALDRDLAPEQIGAFWYNNENYAILGDMITAETGQSTAHACQDRVLTPAGAKGAPHDRVGPMLDWGGWDMGLSDYAAIMQHWYADGDTSRHPRVSVDGAGLDYGAGMFVRMSDAGQTFSHAGEYCIPAQIRMGSFAVSWPEGWVAVAVYDVCTDEGDLDALYAALAMGLFGVVR